MRRTVFLPMEIVLPFLIFPLALFFLIKAADIFVNNAEKMGLTFGIPHFVIGITVVAIGTSLPELATSLVAVFRSTAENDLTPIVAANVIGSNIANILLGIGLASLFAVIKVERDLIDFDLPFLFAGTAMLILFLYDGVLTRGEGFCLFLVFAIFIAFSVLQERDEVKEEHKQSKNGLLKVCALLIASLAVIAVSSDYTIGSLEKISITIGIPASVASMFFLAVGTSFPEIFVSVIMVRKNMHAMAIGNILGSNITNALGIMGIAGLFSTLTVDRATIFIGLPFVAIATLFFIFAGLDKKFQKWEGITAIAIFLIFLGKLFGLI